MRELAALCTLGNDDEICVAVQVFYHGRFLGMGDEEGHYGVSDTF